MYIKIETQEEPPRYYMFECQEFDFQPIPEGIAVENWHDRMEIVSERAAHSNQSVLYINREKQVFLNGCTIYVMNDAGKTIDVLYS